MEAKKNKLYFSDLLIDTLSKLGIDKAAFNPGASFRGIHDSMNNYQGKGGMEMILSTHEVLAVGTACGYYAATGKIMAVPVHNIVGLLHMTKAIYEAYADHYPLLVIGGTGPMDAARRRPGIDSNHTALVQGDVVRGYTKWDDQPEGMDSGIESLIRAYNLTMTPPHAPVYVCYDVELQEAEVPKGYVPPDPKDYPLPTLPAPDESALSKVADLLVRAKMPVFMVDDIGRHKNGPENLRRLVELVAAPVMAGNGSFNLANTHPLNLSGIRVDGNELISQADVVVCINVNLEPTLNAGTSGTTRGSTRKVSAKTKVVRIGVSHYDIKGWTYTSGRYVSIDLDITCDENVGLVRLYELCKARITQTMKKAIDERYKRMKEIHDAARKEWAQEAKKRADETPISLARVATDLWAAIKDYDWVHVAGSLNGWERRLWRYDSPSRFTCSGGDTGTGMGFAIGGALAMKGTNRLPINIQKDGDLLYTGGSLWTAAKYEVPMLVVMYNNHSYYQDFGHQRQMAIERERPMENVGRGINIDEPEVNFATLARSYRLKGYGPVVKPSELGSVLKEAAAEVHKTRRTVVVDTWVQPR